MTGAYDEDIKALKGAILDCLVPKGMPLYPPLKKQIKQDRGFKHERTGALLCPAHLNWNDSA